MHPLNQNEKVAKTVRRHPFVLYARLSVLLLAAFAPLLIYGFMIPFLSEISGGNPGFLFSFFYLMWLYVLILVGFYSWTDYYLDVWIITSEKIIDVEQNGFFARKVSTFNLERIQDVTVEVNGVLATFLQFGDLHIQTAGEHRTFIIRQAQDAVKVKEVILSQVREARKQ